MLYELILINEIEQRSKIFFLSVGTSILHLTVLSFDNILHIDIFFVCLFVSESQPFLGNIDDKLISLNNTPQHAEL